MDTQQRNKEWERTLATSTATAGAAWDSDSAGEAWNAGSADDAGNGHGPDDGWRHRAMDEALRAESLDGNGVDALLRVIRERRPGAATLALWPDRLQLMAFLRERTSGIRRLLPGSDGHIEREQICPYVGWFTVDAVDGAEWGTGTVELALSPNYSVTGPVVVIADDAGTLFRFDRALEAYTIRPAGRCLRYSERWESAPDLDAEIGKVTWDDLVLRPDLLAGLRDAVEGFHDHRDTLRALGFPWKRGLLLVGPPGTGKTMVCKAAAAALPGLPFLAVRDFEAEECSYGDADAIRTIFERARKLAPCILSFEDIDGLVTPGNRTLFLNEMDGFANNDGLLIIASSNHPEKLDEAILKRPSRFDRVFHLGLPGKAERREFCRRLLVRWQEAGRLAHSVDAQRLAGNVAERSEGFTPAYLQEAFVSAALQEAQAGAVPASGSFALGEAFAATLLAQVEELKTHMRRLRDPEALASLEGAGVTAVGFRR